MLRVHDAPMLESDHVSSSSTGPASYRSLLETLREHARSYIAKQLLLPRQEIREIITANLRAAVWLVAGLTFVFLFLIGFVVLVIGIIALWLPLPIAALITMVVFAVIAAILFYVGYRKLVLHGPERSIRSFKETVSWVKASLLGRSES